MNNPSQKITGPLYVQKFLCSAGECEDTCCAGWNIFIDEETCKKYKKVKHQALKVRFDKELVMKRTGTEEAAKIKLKNGRCAFLSEKNLCDIYSTLGEPYLSCSCKLYPRTFNRISGAIECSLVCSCPEAAKVILLNEEKLGFGSLSMPNISPKISAEFTAYAATPQKWQDYFFELRRLMISVMQNRKYHLEERLAVLEVFVKGLEQYVTLQKMKKIPAFIQTFSKDMEAGQIKMQAVNKQSERKEFSALAKALLELLAKKRIKSRRYEACLGRALEGLKLKGDSNLEQAEEAYRLGAEKYQKQFLEKYSYTLENYFVNYMFERCVPVDYENPLQSFWRMRCYYMLLKFHLIGIANCGSEIDLEEVVTLVQSFSKTFDHSEEHLAQLMKVMQAHG